MYYRSETNSLYYGARVWTSMVQDFLVLVRNCPISTFYVLSVFELSYSRIMSVIENPLAYLNETSQTEYDEQTPMSKPGRLTLQV